MTPLVSRTILLAEDDDGHARLVEKNLHRGGLQNEIVRVRDGRQALQFVYAQRNAGRSKARQLLILLDLNMPVMDGYTVLQALKQDTATRYIPVIILSSSDRDLEIQKCYELGCNIYITKPLEYDRFAAVVRGLASFVAMMAIPETP